MADQIAVQLISESDSLEQEAREGFSREYRYGIWGEAGVAGLEHAEISANVYDALRQYAKSHPHRGKAYHDGLSYVLGGTPQQIEVMRLPDASFMTHQQVAQISNPKGFVYFAPLIAVEVVSPSESSADTDAKIADYLAYGTQEVWVVDANSRQLKVHHASGVLESYSPSDILTSALLPDFALPIADVFAGI